MENQVTATEDRKAADKYVDGDLVGVLYRQHAEITEALHRVAGSKGDERRNNFAAVVDLLSRHEAAERELVRPIVEQASESAEAEARNAEETAADVAIAALKALDVDSADFDAQFRAFTK